MTEDFTPEQKAIMELDALTRELEMRLANAEAWIDKLKDQYYRAIDE